MKEIAKEVEFSVRKIIDKKMKAIKDGETSNDDLLSMLLESNIKEIQQHKNKTAGMSIKDVIEGVSYSTWRGRRPRQFCWRGRWFR